MPGRSVIDGIIGAASGAGEGHIRTSPPKDGPGHGAMTWGDIRRYITRMVRSDHIRLFLVLLLIFATFAHWIGANENSRIDLTRAIVEDGQISIEPYANNTRDKALINGKIYSDKAPGSSLAAIPAYLTADLFAPAEDANDPYLVTPPHSFHRTFNQKLQLARFLTVVSVSGVAGAITVVLLVLIIQMAGLLSRTKAILFGVIGGIGTVIFPYSTTFHGTMLATALLTCAVYLWIRWGQQPGPRQTLLICIFLGLGVSTSYLIAFPGIILLLIMFQPSLQQRSFDIRYLYATVGGLVGLSPLLIYNTFVFGHPFDVTMFYATANPRVAEQAGKSLVNPVLFRVHFLTVVSTLLHRLFYPGYGLFLFSPLLLWGVYGMKKLYQENQKLAQFIIGSFLLTLVFISTLNILGEAFFSSRYLLPGAVFLLIPAASAVRGASRRLKTLFSASALVSIIFTLTSTQPWRRSVADFTPVFIESVTVAFSVHDTHLISYYLPNFIEHGLQSPLLSYLTGATPELYMVLDAYPVRTITLAITPDQIITYNIMFLTLAVLIAIPVFFLRHELSEVFHPYTPHLSALLIGAIVVTGIGTATTPYYTGWYPEKTGEQVRWGHQKPSVYFDSPVSHDQYVLELALQTPSDPVHVTGVLNDDRLFNRTISAQATGLSAVTDLYTRNNLLRFRSNRRCQVVGKRQHSGDTRCATVGLNNLTVTPLKKGDVQFAENIWRENGSYLFHRNATIYVRKTGQYAVDINGRAIGNRSNLTVYRDGRHVLTSTIDGFGMNISTPYMQLNGTTRFTLKTTCPETCNTVRGDIVVRRFTDQANTTLYRWGTNWYREPANATERWSTGNASLYLYNYRQESVNRILWIRGKSFHLPRNMTYRLNSEEIATKYVPPTDYRIAWRGEYGTYVPRNYPVNRSRVKGRPIHVQNKYGFNVTLQPGENRLELFSPTECLSIGAVNANNDSRCALFGLKELYLTTQWNS